MRPLVQKLVRTAACLAVCMACIGYSAHGQSPSPSPAAAAAPAPAAAPAGAQEPPPDAGPPQTLSQKTATDYRLKKNASIRAVNLKYIALAQAATDQFVKENNQARADDATNWIKRLNWAVDANLKGLTPDNPDRLGVMQKAYIPERAAAIVSADTAFIAEVEAAQKEAANAGDQQGIAQLLDLEKRIKKELAAGGSAPVKIFTPGEKAVDDYENARNAAVKAVNDKFAALSLSAMEFFVKENNTARADEAKDWARRLAWTDDGGNFNGLTPDNPDRLGALQAMYLKERAAAVTAVAKASEPGVEAVQKQVAGNAKDATAVAELLAGIKKDLAAPTTAAAVASAKPGPASPAAPLTPALKLVADFNEARTAAIKEVNDKYAKLALDMVDTYVKEGNQPRADDAQDWARHLGWTDDVGNFHGLSTQMQDRLGILQTAYRKDRLDAVSAVDKARMPDIEAARGQTSPDIDKKGSVALVQALDLIRHDLGITAPPKPAPAVASSAESSTAPQPAPSTGTGVQSSQPFGVKKDQLPVETAP